MTRFEYLKENLTRRELAKYLSSIENCKGECREFCDKYFISAKENIGCEEVMYEYLGTENGINKEE